MFPMPQHRQFLPFSTMALFILVSSASHLAAEQLFDMKEMYNATSLEIETLRDWHVVPGQPETRQKMISIRVGELIPDREYRVPVRLIVPAKRRARGFHLTGGHQMANIQRDFSPRGIDSELLNGGVGLVHTMVQGLQMSDQARLGRDADALFVKTLNPRYSIQYWGWPATLMRAATAAYAESQHFETGKVALSGGSKNGASPAAALIHDKRFTALHSSVAPIWDSPLRVCDSKAWDELRAHNNKFVEQLAADNPRLDKRRLLNHFFLGGTFGPVYNDAAIAAGHTWNDLQQLATKMADHVFISRNLEQLRKRDADVFFHPGTHDFVAFDLVWGGKNHPTIPIYLRANSGHGQRTPHRMSERDEQNKTAFLLAHFFDDAEPLLPSPQISTKREKNVLHVTVKFPPNSTAESGRIWWIYNRGPDGSVAYITELFPATQWKDLVYNEESDTWTTQIELDATKSRIDLFTNHAKTTTYHSQRYKTYISSPYTRVTLGSK